ncbi:DNA cytosine methyltransferase [Aeromonas rivipollensis]|uniref:DNA cytosine methyltransferase n=1 Tax=Aeromonas rivipollensis TaxID=948519 RepID=UPI00259D6890|nr:DNA cytosine methyltransferase [Aeromonas rivipollensis]MDM5083710.1 DNA cytosine methyltransferase [Aeromonas rivipollensis]MDM5096088.1 DNA cytosine methyltransferase [Aeromonas rivipollensis]MDM5104359.1 DNA cytosine methyltransferase [Aeromonas rivipollensis]
MRKSQVASICRHTFNLFDEIVVDNFAGGGGASTGIEMALGRSPEIAINHDPDAISMHTVNHPTTEHYCESVWDIVPREVVAGRPVGLVWLSPDCKHFSKAKGSTPVSKKIRGLAWVALRWAAQVRPRVIMLENVEEFQTWGPLLIDSEGNARPDPAKKGRTFNSFINALRRQGYKVEWKELRAMEYGVPEYDPAATIRKRLFLIARRDGAPIAWPKPTYGDPRSQEVKAGKLKPWRTAADIIDWSIPCPSIFERKRPLAENTLRRIAKGLERFVINAAEPFIVPVDRGSALAPFITEHANASHQRNMPADEPLRTICAQVKGGHFALVAPVIARQFGNSVGQSVEDPLGTVMAKADKSQLVTAFLAKHYTGVVGAELTQPLPTVTTVDHNALVTSHLIKLRGTCQHGQPVTEPMPTVTAGGLHIGEVRAFLLKYYGTDSTIPCSEPLHTVTTRDRFGLVTVRGEDYQIVDIGMRMLEPHELFAAQGFPADYVIDQDASGKKFTKTVQVARCGNAVCPPLAAALVRANLPEMCADAQEVAA